MLTPIVTGDIRGMTMTTTIRITDVTAATLMTIIAHRENIGSPVRRGDARYEYDLDLDKKRDGVDFELDMERDGKWLEIDIEIGKLDFDLKLDARKLQADTTPSSAWLAATPRPSVRTRLLPRTSSAG